MQINSVAAPNVPSNSATGSSPQSETSIPAQPAQLAEDTVQLSSAAVSSAQEQDDLGLNIGLIVRSPP